MKRQVRIANMANCSGCQLCQLVCSFFNSPQRKFNPAQAHIKISRLGGENRFAVKLLPACTHCGLCTVYCQYEVLEHSQGE